jgi:hypothetical protein
MSNPPTSPLLITPFIFCKSRECKGSIEAGKISIPVEISQFTQGLRRFELQWRIAPIKESASQRRPAEYVRGAALRSHWAPEIPSEEIFRNSPANSMFLVGTPESYGQLAPSASGRNRFSRSIRPCRCMQTGTSPRRVRQGRCQRPAAASSPIKKPKCDCHAPRLFFAPTCSRLNSTSVDRPARIARTGSDSSNRRARDSSRASMRPLRR